MTITIYGEDRQTYLLSVILFVFNWCIPSLLPYRFKSRIPSALEDTMPFTLVFEPNRKHRAVSTSLHSIYYCADRPCRYPDM
jgi:hypothetical protein